MVIHTRDTIEDIYLVELIEKSRYLTLKLAPKYGMLRLIDNRITFELLAKFVIPKRKSVSTHHEQIRTLENIVGLDKAGIIISPEIGLHENVAVLDFNDEYANIITRHNISYENLSSDVVLTKEIETWRGFIDNLPSDEDKVEFTKLLDGYYKYSVALNNQAQDHPFPAESLILALL